jgi:BlaI family transcriptional regulator, penicillinase repressor
MVRFRLPADDLEYAVLTELWARGVASVRDLHERLGKPEGLVYTTTAKVVDRLRDKGLVARRRRGHTFRYRPRIAREDVERARAQNAVRRLVGATPHAAMAALVEAVDSVHPDLLAALESAVADRRRSKDGA